MSNNDAATTTVIGVHETVLYVPDIRADSHFYQRVVGLRCVGTPDAGGVALRLPTGDAILLLFTVEHARQTGRHVPAHGATGPGHVAFRVPPGTLGAWRAHLESSRVELELERDWDCGGRSIYVRDPAGNSVDFVEGTIWPA
ncbi:MAG: VOC family protein [Phycisphaerales bacterium]